MGERSDFERKPRDYYQTPLEAFLPLVEHLPKSFVFTEPCAGNSKLTGHIKSAGGICYAEYDIEPQNSNVKMLDATTLKSSHIGNSDFIITNPPWIRTKKSGYLLHRLIETFSDISPTWLLIDSDWHETKQSGYLIGKYCKKILPIGRVKWFGDTGGKDNSSWYLFDKNKDSETIFIPRK